MKSTSTLADKRRAARFILTVVMSVSACNGSDGSGSSIASNPSLATSDSPTLATTAKNYTGRFKDSARGFDLTITFAPGVTPHGKDGVLFSGDDDVSSYFATAQSSTQHPSSDGLSTEFDNSQTFITFVAPGNDGSWYTADDIPSSYVKSAQQSLPDGGWTARNTSFSGAGPDGNWFTTDDAVSRYDQTTRVSGTDSWSTVTYTAPGSDGIWFTADDLVETRFRDASPDNENILSSAGVDGVLDTEDDFVCSTTRVSNGTAVNGAGAGAADTQSFITDTVAFSTNSSSCSAAPVRIGDWYEGPQAPYRTTSLTADTTSDYVIYGNPGPDGQWRTSDDIIDAHFVSASPLGFNSPPFNPSHFTFYDNPGLDGQWFTADDHIARAGVNNDPRWIANVSDKLPSTIQFSAPGPDESWFTEDDVVVIAQRSLGGFFGGWDRANISYRDTGPDHILGTSDDTVSHYVADVCKDGGHGLALAERLEFAGPGPDNTWFTPDDEVSSYRGGYVQYDSNTTTLAEICSPVPDSIWGPTWF